MSEPQQLVTRWRDAFNSHDREGMRAVYAEDVIFEAPGDVRVHGADATVEYAMSWLDAFPDARFEVETEVAEGEWVVQRFVFEGTHGAGLATPMGEIPATGRRLAGRGVEVTRVEDGEITEEYLYFDQMQVLTQLGVVREQVGARG